MSRHRMRFLRLDALNWWEVLPVLVACWAIHQHYVRSLRRRAAIAPRFGALSRRSTWKREAGVLAASLLAASALVFVLVRPQVVLAERVPEFERQDLIICSTARLPCARTTSNRRASRARRSRSATFSKRSPRASIASASSDSLTPR